MSTADVVRLAPWLLAKSRPFTQYELSIVTRAIRDGIVLAGVDTHKALKDARFLTDCIARAPETCVSFRASFGPAPAVPYSFYVCVGRGYAKDFESNTLRTPTELQQIGSHITSGALCSAPRCSDPAVVLDLLLSLLPRVDLKSLGLAVPPLQPAEGLPQISLIGPTNADEELRARTGYQLTTGQKIIDLVESVQRTGFPVPPAVTNLLAFAKNPLAVPFLSREFLLGATIKANIDYNALSAQVVGMTTSGAALNPQSLTTLAKYIVEDVVAVWAPGQGISVLPYLLGTADPAQILSVIMGSGVVTPDLVGGIISALPGLAAALPGLFQPPSHLRGVASTLGGRLRWLSGPAEGVLVTPGYKLLQVPPPPLPQGAQEISIPRSQLDPSVTTAPTTSGGSDSSGVLLAVGAAVVVGAAMLLSGGDKN